MVTLRAKKVKKGFSLFLDIYEKGQRQKEYLKIYVSEDYTKGNNRGGKKRIKTEDKDLWDLAEKIALQKEVELRNNDYGFVASFKQNASFSEYFEKKLTKKNNPTYLAAFKHFTDFAGTNISFKAINESLLNRFKEYLLTKYNGNTSYTYLKRMNIIWNEAMREKITTQNPFFYVDKPKQQQPKRDFLTLEEVQQFADTNTKIPQIIKNAFLFACFTGLRFSDVKKLTWLEIEDEILVFRQKKSDTEVLRIPLSANAKKILEKMDKDKVLVFDGMPSNEYTNRKLKVIQKEANLSKRLHFHLSRHTFATIALENGMDFYILNKIFGHSELKTTEIYGKITDKPKKQAIDNLPNITI